MLKEILKQKAFFIFDMDGTITDTEPLHFVSYQRTLSELFPELQLHEEEFLSCYVGHPEREIYTLLQQVHHISFDEGAFFQRRITHLFRLVRETGLTTAPFYRQICSLFPNKKRIMLASAGRYWNSFNGKWTLADICHSIYLWPDRRAANLHVCRTLCGILDTQRNRL